MGSPGDHVPSRLGRYELLARLATGGMGEIFLARLEGAAGFEKLFVVKRILPHLADDARFRGMLIAEAQIASKMSHANICQVYELGETDGQLYIVMEYLEGITMLPLLRRCSKENKPLDFGFVGAVIQQATDALHYAHELRDRNGEYMGIVHRDVTPSNIFLTESGVAKVLDFGIAKVKDASAHTQTGTVKGKYAYMAPEQLRGHAVDRRADVFALGVATYEMLALRRLFQRKTDYLTFRAVMEQPIPDVRRYRPDVPDVLAEALNRALDRDPDQRYTTARLFGSAILDGLVKRPWTQGELSDFLKADFSEEIHKRSAEVAQVIHRTKPGTPNVGRPTMPLIVQDDEPLDDGEDEFPSVESTLSDAPPLEALRRAASPNSGQPGDFVGGTPPPFGADSRTGSGPSLNALPPPIQQPKRSLLWPLVAIAAVGIAGAALFLVWKQMQNPGPPPVVNITASPAIVEQPTAIVIPEEEPVDPPPRTKPVTPKQPPVAPKKSPYDVAIQQQRSKINACATEHGAPEGQARVVIEIATNGKAKTVSLEPTKLNTTPLGACIKHVLSVATFPTAKEEMKVAVALKAN
jgi:eukaryotic-like serine/threonine-protein kinase